MDFRTTVIKTLLNEQESIQEDWNKLIDESEEYSDYDVEFVLEFFDYLDELDKSGYVALSKRVNDPDYTGTTSSDRVIAKAKKQHGDKFAKDLDGVGKMRAGGMKRIMQKSDPLKGNSSTRTTSTGKANKQDVKALKNKIKSRLN